MRPWEHASTSDFTLREPAAGTSGPVALCLNKTLHPLIAMLSWAVVFFLIAIVAAVFGFSGIAEAAAGIAQILFFIFIVLFIISVFFGAFRGKRPPM